MHARAAADARLLPAAARPGFASGLARSVSTGLQADRGQPLAPIPAGTPPSLTGQGVRAIPAARAD